MRRVPTGSTGSVNSEERKQLMSGHIRNARLALVAGLVALIALVLATTPAQAADEFGVVPGTFTNTPTTTQAGAHGDWTTNFRFNTHPDGQPLDNVKDVVVDLPAGVVGDPRSTPKCTAAELSALPDDTCPPDSQVGRINLDFIFPGIPFPLQTSFPVYNMAPRGDKTAELGFKVVMPAIFITVEVRPGGDGLRAVIPNISTDFPLLSSSLTLWGNPADPVHDPGRGVNCYGDGMGGLSCGGGSSTGMAPKAFMRNSTQCGVARETKMTIASWQNPALKTTLAAPATTMTDCDRLSFNPDLTLQAGNDAAGQPTGVTVDLTMPQSDVPEDLAAPDLKKAVVTLPPGMAINPPSADGLQGCTSAQIGLDNIEGPACPDAAKIGSVRIDTPLLDTPLTGGVFLAQPYDNKFDSMLALYLVAQGSGVTLKLPGRIDTDPKTGQVTATFDNNPQMPFTRLRLSLNGGPRASLSTPATCGTYETRAELTAWSGQVVNLTTPMTVNRDCDTHSTFTPRSSAGMTNAVAGGSSPFVLAVARSAGDKEMSTLRSIQLPEGLLGRVASVPLCQEAQATTGNCPEESRVGQVQVAAGAGSSPLWVPMAGNTATAVYMTTGFKGAPYGLSIVIPAQAGPFNLGTVVVRSALHVDERTAQLSTGIDESRVYDRSGSLVRVIEGEMPRILEGIPLKLRELRVLVDRDEFMFNPTNCSTQQVTADAVAADGQVASLASRFTAVNCAKLGFAPRFAAKVLDGGRRSTVRSFNPRMRFAVAPRPGHANIGRAAVTLPSSVILDQSHIRTICTRAQFAERNCPEASIYGYARAWSPILRKAIEGPVYLGASSNKLPDLIADMDGEVRVVLQGRIDTAKGGRLRTTFDQVPDAPVSRFALTMRGGNRGILVNSTDLCRSAKRGVANFGGQNGRRSVTRPRIQTAFKGCAKVRRKAARRTAVTRSAMAAASHRRPSTSVPTRGVPPIVAIDQGTNSLSPCSPST